MPSSHKCIFLECQNLQNSSVTSFKFPWGGWVVALESSDPTVLSPCPFKSYQTRLSYDVWSLNVSINQTINPSLSVSSGRYLNSDVWCISQEKLIKIREKSQKCLSFNKLIAVLSLVLINGDVSQRVNWFLPLSFCHSHTHTYIDVLCVLDLYLPLCHKPSPLWISNKRQGSTRSEAPSRGPDGNGFTYIEEYISESPINVIWSMFVLDRFTLNVSPSCKTGRGWSRGSELSLLYRLFVPVSNRYRACSVCLLHRALFPRC